MEVGEEEGAECCSCCRTPKAKKIFNALIFGQILSLCLCGTGVASQLLTEKFNVRTPAAQGFTNYFFLCFVYTTLLSCRDSNNGLVAVVRARGWKYFVIAFLDVQANYLVVYAYQYTNLTSIQVLDIFTIPVVLLLSWLCLSVRYLISHIIGVSICLLGVGCLIYADYQIGKGSGGGSNRLLGDALCLFGVTLYGVTNVCEEFFVKNYNRIEYLGMIGLFGSVISGIQLAVFERKELVGVKWQDYRIDLLYLLFAACMFILYSLVSVYIQKTSATMFNLSILTADVYVLLFGLVIFKYTFHILYFGSFLLVIIGSIVYAARDTHKHESISGCPCCPRDRTETDQRPQYDELPGTVEGLQSEQTEMNSVVVKYCPVHGPITAAVPPADPIST